MEEAAKVAAMVVKACIAFVRAVTLAVKQVLIMRWLYRHAPRPLRRYVYHSPWVSSILGALPDWLLLRIPVKGTLFLW